MQWNAPVVLPQIILKGILLSYCMLQFKRKQSGLVDILLLLYWVPLRPSHKPYRWFQQWTDTLPSSFYKRTIETTKWENKAGLPLIIWQTQRKMETILPEKLQASAVIKVPSSKPLNCSKTQHGDEKPMREGVDNHRGSSSQHLGRCPSSPSSQLQKQEISQHASRTTAAKSVRSSLKC